MYKFLCALVMYIVIISSVMSYSIFEIESNEVDGVTLPSSFFADKLEFTEINEVSDVFTANKLTSNLYYKLINGTLEFENGLPLRYEDIFLLGVQPQSNGNYEVSYNISNPDNSDFRFWIHNGGFVELGSVYVEFTDNTVALKRKDLQAIIIVDTTIAETTLSNPTSGIVKTIYNPKTGYVEILHNNIAYISTYIDKPSSVDFYGGIGVYGYSFTLNGIATPIIVQTDSTPNIFEIIGSLLLWNVSEEYIPAWLNIVLIKVPIIFLALAIAFYIRGVS